MEQRRNWLTGLLLFLGTMAVYWPVTHFPFVSYDDQLYVYENPDILNGLTWHGFIHAFTSIVCDNWLPMTQLSHMVDCSLFHLFAGGHHLTSVLLHAINAVLLWQLLKRLTGTFWPSALVAALFAWHPMNVESVVWIAERNNVLSQFFFILTLGAYLSYVETRRMKNYLLALGWFALGLMAKPMLVTLPFLLLLLDYWPLGRISLSPGLGKLLHRRETWKLLLEKAPFLFLAIADCVVTFIVQSRSGAVRSLAECPLAIRLLNIPVAYMTYVAKSFWPVKLCVLYVFPEKPAVVAAVISFVCLMVITFLIWRGKTRFPWLVAGWFFFIGSLVPVIGLVQSGDHATADRYAYLPFLGLFLIMAFGLKECLVAAPSFRIPAIAASAIFLCFCLILTRRQLACWQDGKALFTQALMVNPENADAEDLLGRVLSGSGQPAEAIRHFTSAVRLHPRNPSFQYDLGRELIEGGRFSEAENPLAAAVAQMPEDPIFHNAYGVTLMQTGNAAAAAREFSRAVKLMPAYPKPYFNLGKMQLDQGQNQAAIQNFTTALRLEPDWSEAWEGLAGAEAAANDWSNAVRHAGQALSEAQADFKPALARQIAADLAAYQKQRLPK